MIIVKCIMNKMPKSCNKCVYYASERIPFDDPDRICYGNGKGILLNNNTRVTVERSKDYPLIESEMEF